VQTLNGSEFGTSFHLHLLDLGVDHVRIKPRTPRLNGKVERSHRDWTSPGIVEASAIRSSDAREAQQVRPGVP
jgi:transposase InsO family protein